MTTIHNVFQFSALEFLYNLRTILEVRKDIDREDMELIMELSPLHLQRLEDANQQGIEEGKRLIVDSLLQVKFGEIDEELAQIIEPLIQLETLDDCTRLTMQLDRSQLLARFQPENQTES